MTDRIFTLQDAYDATYASDRRSRYGAYLAQHAHRFRDWDDTPTRSPAEFAAAAFVVATVPIMGPPYVGTHPRVVLAQCHWDEDRRCGLAIELATPLASELALQLPEQTVGWEREIGSGQYYAREDNDLLTVYSRLTVRVPFPVGVLPEPAYAHTGAADVDTAKRALRALTMHTNTVLTHLITALDNTALDSAGGAQASTSRRPSISEDL